MYFIWRCGRTRPGGAYVLKCIKLERIALKSLRPARNEMLVSIGLIYIRVEAA